MDYEIHPDEPVSMAVVQAVSELNGRDPCSIRPLAEILDPDALNTLFSEQVGEFPRVGGRITFVYEQCRVTVEAGEYLTVEPIGPDLPTGTTRRRAEN